MRALPGVRSVDEVLRGEGRVSVTLTADEERADAFLVVRPGAERAPALLVLSTTTWQAYNDWGGTSLYVQGTRVSFDRPFAKGFLVKPRFLPSLF